MGISSGDGSDVMHRIDAVWLETHLKTAKADECVCVIIKVSTGDGGDAKHRLGWTWECELKKIVVSVGLLAVRVSL